MNPFKTDVCLKQDELLGEAELINPQDIKIIFLEDCEQRNQPVRRIQLDDRLQKGDNYSKIKESNTFQGSNSSQTTNVPDYLSDLYYRAVQEMTSDESQKISDLLCRYQTTFSKNNTDLGLTTLVQHEIDTGDSRPIKQPPRRVPLAFADEERKVVQQMEAQGIIRKSSSPWASHIV